MSATAASTARRIPRWPAYARVGPILLALAATAGQPVRAKPHIEALEATLVPEGVAVSFHVADGISEEILERIRSGIPVSFKHRIEILSRRSVPLWPARVVARMRVETRVTYDALNRSYDLVRVATAKRPKPEVPPLEQARTTDSLEQALAWLTRLDFLPVIPLPADAATARLRVKAESTLGRRYVLYIFYARQIISAERRLGG